MFSGRMQSWLYVGTILVNILLLGIAAASFGKLTGSSDLGYGMPTMNRARPGFARMPVQTRRSMTAGARVGGVDIPNRKRVEVALQSIYGIGKATSKSILQSTGVENKRTYELDEDELTKLRAEVDKYVIEGDLRRQIRQDIARLIDIQCFRGKRHQAGLPCRGQNTKNNARTRKRNRHVKI
mmetsp:Transcript_7126/g.13912  ORF Transcript_7126/g.13912 Transcript_7126/m.13912 type:complete len:182 (-) Transcript_7126:388-933(-)|eukprot:CAMPEP_0167816962 /NCGR_PEP_ID=MMETSP0112_2-20121227/3914_1 /TAXON_ID=91324 /ORGANISM="Lotharella globosa, Strain CCCM811" /LENGTH=181 /DNA_ID=CAMNT_0007716641 /DNA_START=799 /DNA_END=1344 /DNA_ORIENTATION=-